MIKTVGAAVGALLILAFLAICAGKLTWHDPTEQERMTEARR